MANETSSPRYPDVRFEIPPMEDHVRGNVFWIIGQVQKELRKAGHSNAAGEFSSACFGAGSYDEVLDIVAEYVST